MPRLLPSWRPAAGSGLYQAAAEARCLTGLAQRQRRSAVAKDMFLKLGNLKGEAKDKAHKEEIDVLAWSWGVSNTGSAHAGGGAGSGKCSVRDLSFTKYIDKSSPDLILA